MQFNWAQYKGNLGWLESRTIFLTVSGSRAYNTSNEASDWDYRGVAMAPKEYYLGFNKRFEQVEIKDPDLTIFELQKFMKLAAACNPNILEILYTEPKDHLVVTSAGQRLIDNRELFISQKAKHTFSGYAISQLKRIKNDDWSGRNLKHAMHLVRLMTMCREILQDGKVIVKRPDAEFLLSIRNGAWSYEKLIDWAQKQDNELTSLMQHSKLPKMPDMDKLDKLCVELIAEAL